MAVQFWNTAEKMDEGNIVRYVRPCSCRHRACNFMCKAPGGKGWGGEEKDAGGKLLNVSCFRTLFLTKNY